MQRRRVGASGLEVSRIGLGTMTWGESTPLDTATAQLSAFVEAGGTLVETADGYGDGAAQQVLGEVLAAAVSREQLVIAGTTDVHGWLRGWDYFANAPDSSRGLTRVATILDSVARTGRVVVAEEGQGFAGFGSEVLSQLAEHGLPQLRATRVAAAPHAIPSARPLEELALPTASSIVRATLELIDV